MELSASPGPNKSSGHLEPMFIALEGIDGCGKSTLAELCAGRLHEQGVRFLSRRTVATTSPFVENLMSSLSTMLWYSGDARDLSADFWIGLQAAWFSALSDHGVNSATGSGHLVLVDGWIYKFFAKLLLQDYQLASLDCRFEGVRRPDHVILIDVDPSAVLQRKRTMRATELGLHAGYGTLDENSFVDYQSRLRRNLDEFAARDSWSTLTIGPDEAPETSAARLATLVQELSQG